MHQRGEDESQGEQGDPDGLSQQQAAENCADGGAEQERDKYFGVGKKLFMIGLMACVQALCLVGKSYTHLPDMVGDKGGGHGDALGLAEGIVLHGGDKVDGNLGDLYRR